VRQEGIVTGGSHIREVPEPEVCCCVAPCLLWLTQVTSLQRTRVRAAGMSVKFILLLCITASDS
jgi:hypothetical protein